MIHQFKFDQLYCTFLSTFGTVAYLLEQSSTKSRQSVELGQRQLFLIPRSTFRSAPTPPPFLFLSSASSQWNRKQQKRTHCPGPTATQSFNISLQGRRKKGSPNPIFMQFPEADDFPTWLLPVCCSSSGTAFYGHRSYQLRKEPCKQYRYLHQWPPENRSNHCHIGLRSPR